MDRVLRRATNELSEGHTDRAIELCQQIIRENPNAADAYVLLGMAEEEAGNLRVAIGAYQQALSLEPDRNAQREKIALLEERLTEEESVAESEQDRLQRLTRWAPVVLALSLALLVLVGATAGISRVRNVRQAAREQRAYDAALQRGRELVTQRRYDEALSAFREAQAARPGDVVTQRWWQYAYQLQQQEVEHQQYVLRTGAGTLALEPTGNLFAPVPIGPRSAEPPSTAAARRSATAPPSVRSGVDWSHDLPTLTVPEGAGPLVAPDGPQPAGVTEEGPGAEPSGEPSAAQPPRPSGEISILVNEPRRGSVASASAEELRAGADRLREQGGASEAIAKYQQAIEQYQRESQQEPLTAPAKRSAIDSCEQAIRLLQDRTSE